MFSRQQFGGLLILASSVWLLWGGGGINPFVPPAPPSPIDTTAKMALIVYESGQSSKLPPEQAAALNSGRVEEYLTANVDKDDDGHPLFRKWDKDVDLEFVDKIWKDAMAIPRDSVPWLIITNGNTGTSEKFPETADAVIETAKKYLEK